MFTYYGPRVPKYVKEFVENAIDYLDLRYLDAELDIYCVDSISDHEYGYCFGESSHVEIVYGNRTGDICLPRTEKLLTLAHEMVHAKQILRGELINEKKRGNEMNRWTAKPVPFDFNVWSDADCELDSDAYRNLPWEREAFGRQEEVYENCRRDTKTYTR